MNSRPFQIVLWGDSIFQYADKNNGWATLLRERYQGKCLITSLGISGLNTQ